MYSKDSIVSASFKEISGYLVSPGKYKSSVIDVKNPFKKDEDGNSLEIIKTLKPFVTKQRPAYKCATKQINFGYEFIKMALNINEFGKSERPKKPKKGFEYWLNTDEGKLWQMWNKATDEQKIQIQLEKWAHDDGTELIAFEIMK